ncbi:hypothetical protein HBA55_34470 [Pseudomaricurvus alkylphenolicus]|uniref:hypothetical protein n=1 Tax=Pseudomaricurvus alkylphenolicus TaxID=1306991 RepID=UPI00141FC2C3|nr:hypothetical protein [Pseudomaricurvus alkylphenolicus]NIB44736.1 hypothetical protein [Pseudomaricurvus alkylphenolicus]
MTEDTCTPTEQHLEMRAELTDSEYNALSLFFFKLSPTDLVEIMGDDRELIDECHKAIMQIEGGLELATLQEVAA